MDAPPWAKTTIPRSLQLLVVVDVGAVWGSGVDGEQDGAVAPLPLLPLPSRPRTPTGTTKIFPRRSWRSLASPATRRPSQDADSRTFARLSPIRPTDLAEWADWFEEYMGAPPKVRQSKISMIRECLQHYLDHRP